MTDAVKRGTLFGVSVGPGDPDLLTLKAVRVIREANVVAAPNIGHKRQTALGIAWEYVQGKQIIDCSTPMTKDRAVVRAAYARIADDLCAALDAGDDVAYLCLGDIGVYSTYYYVHEIVVARGYRAEVVPGVTSFSAVAAKLGMALCEGPERLMVAPVMASSVEDVLDADATKVFMKSGRDLDKLRDALQARGLLEHASMVANCGLPDERVYLRLADAPAESDYFSVVIVKPPAR